MPKFIDCGIDPVGEILKKCVAVGLCVEDDPGGAPFHNFLFGTLNGLYRTTADTMEILAVENELKGNGHFRLFLQHLHGTYRRIAFKKIMNEELSLRLFKCGYKESGNDMIWTQLPSEES